MKLRADIGDAGGILKSPTIEFGEDSDSLLVENLLASVSQHQRQKNGEETIARMRSRVMGGYWPFAAAVGYKFKRVPGQGNMLVRNEPHASILQEALEGFANGGFRDASRGQALSRTSAGISERPAQWRDSQPA